MPTTAITIITTKLKMLDDFFSRALIAGIGLALTTGPLGCFIIWRRMAHSSLLGIALAFLLEIDPTIGVFAIAVLVSMVLLVLQRRQVLSSDALLGILSHSALAIGLVAVGFMSWIRVDLMGLLFGDILSVSRFDIVMIWGGGAFVIVVLAFLWRPLLAATVSEELAEAEGLNPQRARVIFMLMMALVIAIAMKLVGVLLITALMIIPAAAARRLANTPEVMAVLAAGAGSISVIGGLTGSLHFDTPSGPSIVVAALVLFLISLLPCPRGRTTQGSSS